MPGALCRAMSSIASAKSIPTTPPAPIRRSNSSARSPVPVATSRARSPGPTRAMSTARRRHRWCMPAVITEFMRSYTRAMRSNIARTCVSGSVPSWGAARSSGVNRRLLLPGALLARVLLLLLLEGRDEGHELLELLRVLLLKALVGRHRRRGVDERAGDGAAAQAVTDLGEVGPEGVPVLPDLVAAEAARGCKHFGSLFVPGRHRYVDLARRPSERADDAEVGHGRDRGHGPDHRDRALERVPLGAAVIERQQEEQDQADRGDAERGHEHQRRRLDDPQQLEEEE